MKLELELIIKNAKPLCLLNDNELLISKGSGIHVYNFSTKSLKKATALPLNVIKKLFLKSKLLSRLLRLEVRNAINIHDHLFAVVFDKAIHEVNLNSHSNRKVFNIPRGSGPLSISHVKGISGFDDGLMFGEYFSNFKKDKVHVYQRKVNKGWQIVYTFPLGVMEHIHSIVPDKYNDCLWILAGDSDDSACIWMAKNNFSTVIPIVKGNQIYRACVAFPTEDGLLYATDSQFHTNSIRLLEYKQLKWQSTEITSINGSSIYGCTIGNNFCFSTTVEGDSLSKGKFMRYLDRTPGPGIKSSESHVVVGNLRDGFHVMLKKHKDMFPFLLFQFGTFLFPTGKSSANRLICYDIALKGQDMNTSVYNLNIKPYDDDRNLFRKSKDSI